MGRSRHGNELARPKVKILDSLSTFTLVEIIPVESRGAVEKSLRLVLRGLVLIRDAEAYGLTIRQDCCLLSIRKSIRWQ
jgi:hypothetical protein